jgi:hypothetical protein
MITCNDIDSTQLGNQLFRYAALKSLSLDRNFEIGLPIHKNIDLLKCFDIDNIVQSYSPSKEYVEPSYMFCPDFFNISDNTNITGWFQSYKYIMYREEQVLNSIHFKKNIKESAETLFYPYINKEVISIHIRRGDYLLNPETFAFLDMPYYQEAMNYFTRPNSIFMVFSNDMVSAKELLGVRDNIIYMENNSHHVDLYLMSMCDHHIIANSTFSYWGAYFNRNVRTVVIAPRKWLIDRDCSDITPPSWILK